MYPVDASTEYNRASASGDAISVSRVEARKYAAYWKWYKNEFGDVFSSLGLYLSKQDSAYMLPGRIGQALGDAGAKSTVQAIRNSVPKIVGFYAATLLTGDIDDALPVEAGEKVKDSDKLTDAIIEVWKASNLAQNKNVLVRYTAIFGQMFIKVVRPESKDYCYLQLVKPEHVTSYETDERGNVVFARLDVPDTEETGTPQERKVWRSEVWSKEEQYAVFATAVRNSDDTVPAERSLREQNGAKVYELGSDRGFPFNFVPLVAVNAADTGEKRPPPVYESGLNLIAWINKEATRLSDLLMRHNKAHKAIVGIGNDPSGRPLPPPRPDGVRDLGEMQRESTNGDGTVPFGGSRGTMLNHQEDISIDGVAVVGLPGTANVVDIAPNIDYAAAREWIKDHLRELYEECPELLYYAVESRANQSGAALRTLIAGALDRASEMRSNILSALIKADEMALTVAQLAGIEKFSEAEIGTYENGDFEHSFEVGEILPRTEEEQEEAQKTKLENAESLMGVLNELGVSRDKQRETVLKELGYEELAEQAPEDSAEPAESFSEREAEGSEGNDRDAARAALQRRLSGRGA